MIGQPEVDDLDPTVLVKEQVLRFEVPVNDADLVDILNPCQNLLHEGDGLLLIQPLFPDDVIKEFSPGRVLHNEMNICFGFDNLA